MIGIILLGILLVLEGVDLVSPFMSSKTLGILMIVVGAVLIVERLLPRGFRA